MEGDALATNDLLDAAIVNSILAPAPSSEPMHYQQRQKLELAYLRQQAADLKLQLDALTNTKALQVESSGNHWEKVARNQKLASEMATLENARLKRVMEDQITLASALEKVLAKRPRLAATPTMDMADWKLRRLPTDPTRRATAFHAIVDDAYQALETMYVRSGIWDDPPGHRSLGISEDNDMILVSIKSVVNVIGPYLEVGDRFWSVWNASGAPTSHHLRLEIVDRFGENGVYVRMSVSLDATMPCMYLMYAIKRYVLGDRVIIVQKTILDDESHPVPPGVLVGNYSACMVAQAIGPDLTSRRVVVQGKLPAQPPMENPLRHQNLHVSDAVLKMVRLVFDTLEQLFS
ncbi:hypothetical protein SDRG_05551 [Saprolegnia diclina VS20]|uniref:START domain-containing protein n=1 Tax=Saprolegnia diclina (strain VS20) TaxID=1156394 RepID=T0RXG1_SAPDV|nr:hypothetical protein SDRG_05551 [Saprolegnia diclina VS20]EQC37333.1 hypothetical protein SDRG_05551 [Saprolegnia diclina VS20]|eukprot:XP_008609495.1 hypothetical protein SDRG_05551 [Saprolegnia diclina VS20]